MNRTTIIGNIGRDVELSYTKSGIAVCEFSVAVNESYKKGDEWVENTTWMYVKLWREAAERAVTTLQKGDRIYVEGKASTEAYLNKQGEPVAKLVVTANVIHKLAKSSNGGGGRRGTEESEVDYEQRLLDNDIPF